MERNQYTFAIILSTISILGFVSFSLCVAAEFKRSTKNDLRLDGKLCYLPGTVAFELGTAALVFLFVAQIIGNLLICKDFCSRNDQSCSNPKAQKPIIAILFLALSWISFGVAVILIGSATSMNRYQHFGEGWLDGECYIVRDGVYIGSALLILITLSSTISSSIILIRRREAEQGRKVHAQAE